MTRNRKSIRRIILLMVLACSFRLATSGYEIFAAGTDVAVTVNTETGPERRFALIDLAGLPRRSIRATDETGKESLFEGVLVGEVLKSAGVKFGKELSGKALTNYLLVEAVDGYRVVFALPELDPAFTDAIVLLADHRDGKAMSDRDGKLRLIVPHEKRHARWVRQVVRFTVQRVQ